MLKPQIYQHFTCPKSNNSFGPYYKILPHCFRAQLSEIIILTKYNNLYENLHAKSNRCLCRRGKPDGIGLNWIFTKRCLFYFTYIFLWILTETSTTQQLTKMCVKQSHLLLICKGWSFIKQNNLWLLQKWPSFFTKSKKKISVPRYQIGNTQGIVEKTRPFCSLCYLHNTDIESLIYSIYEISVHKTRFALFTGQCIDLPPHAVPWLDVAAGLPRITKSLAHCE